MANDTCLPAKVVRNPPPCRSVDQATRLDAFLDQLTSDHQPTTSALSSRDVRNRLMAAQLRLIRDGVEIPTPAFLQALEQTVESALEKETTT